MNLELLKKYLREGYYVGVNNRLILKFNLHNLFKYWRTILSAIRRNEIKLINKKREDSKDKKVQGDRVQIGTSFGNILVFDSVEDVVFRVYINNRIDMVREGIDDLSQFYAINKLQFVNEFTTKEKIIQGETMTEVDETRQIIVFECILKRYKESILKENYIKHKSKLTVEEFYNQLKETNYPTAMINYIELNRKDFESLFDTIDWIWAHSDLTPDNVIVLNDNSHKVIDLESCEVMPLFYDIINLMFTADLMSKNNTSIQNYFNGKYDEIISLVTKNDLIDVKDRNALFLLMLSFKSIIAWDAEDKRKDINLMKSRWETVSNYIQN